MDPSCEFTSYFHNAKRNWNFGRWVEQYHQHPSFPTEKPHRHHLFESLLQRFAASTDDAMKTKARTLLSKMKKKGAGVNVTMNKVIMKGVNVGGDMHVTVGNQQLPPAGPSNKPALPSATGIPPVEEAPAPAVADAPPPPYRNPTPTPPTNTTTTTTTPDVANPKRPRSRSLSPPRDTAKRHRPDADPLVASKPPDHDLLSFREALYDIHSQLGGLRGEVDRLRNYVAMLFQHEALKALDGMVAAREETPASTIVDEVGSATSATG